MLPLSLCRLWQPDRAANAAQDSRSYTTAWGTIPQCHAGRLWSVRPPPEGVEYLWRLCAFAPERVGRSWLVSPRVTSVEIALRPIRPLFGAGSLSVLAVSAQDSPLPIEGCQPPKARRAKVYVAFALGVTTGYCDIQNRCICYSERSLYPSLRGDGGNG